MIDNKFKEQLHDIVSNHTRITAPLIVGKTPLALAICGAAKDIDVVITKKVIDKCMSPETRDVAGKYIKKNGHNLSEQQLIDAIECIYNPAIVLTGAHANTLVIICSNKDYLMREIIIAISLDMKADQHTVHKISSIYGRDKFTEYIEQQFDNGKLMAANKKLADKLLRPRGLYLPKGETFISYDDTITYTLDNVKYPTT